MMTVQDLINKLEEVEDKTLPVIAERIVDDEFIDYRITEVCKTITLSEKCDAIALFIRQR